MVALARQSERSEASAPRTGGAATRRCLASGDLRPRDELLRFVVGPDGVLVPDLADRLPGRGIWLTPSRELLQRAIARRLFARAAQGAVSVPEGLSETLAGQLRKRCLDLLGLSRRAGRVAAGHDLARALLEQGEADLLLQASDGAEAPRRRLATLGRGINPDLEVVELFDAEELGTALGRAPTVHVAVAASGVVEKLRREVARLEKFEATAPDPDRK